MLGAQPVSTPMAPHPRLTLHGTKLIDPREYIELIGSLQYLAFTPDISYAINKLYQFMHAPINDHMQAVKGVLRYLVGALTHGIFIRVNSPISLHAFSDAEWAGNMDDFVSTNAYILYFGSTPISWSSKKHKGIARSSTNAEYRVVANITAEVRWVCSLLLELHVNLPTQSVIYCNNVGATYLCANSVFHSRIKHIALDYHFVRDNIRSNALHVTHISIKDQLVDALTKPLPRPRFLELNNKIGVTQIPPY